MVSKKDLQKRLNEAISEIHNIRSALRHVETEWLTSQNFALKETDKAKDTAPVLFNENNNQINESIDKDELLMLYDYQIPFKYVTEYYWRATSVNCFGYFATAANVVSKDERLSNLDIYTFILWSVMFDNLALGIKDGIISMYNVLERKNDKVKAYKWVPRGLNSIKNNKLLDEKQNVEEFVENVDIFSLQLFWDGVGYWVRCIPDLGREIYWERGRDDVAGLLTIIPIQDSLNPDVNQVLNKVFYNKGRHILIKQDDKQIRAGSQSDNVWIVPPMEAYKAYDTLTANYNFWKQTWRHKIGIPFGNTQGANSGDDFRDNYETPKLMLMRVIWDFFKNIKEKLGLNLEIKEDYMNEDANDLESKNEEVKNEGNNDEGGNQDEV